MEKIKDIKDFFKKVIFEIEETTEEEARQDLIEMGVDVEKIEKMKEEFLRKLEAREKLLIAQIEKEKMNKIIQKLNEKNVDENSEYKIAARKSNDEIEADERDKKILELIKKKNFKQKYFLLGERADWGQSCKKLLMWLKPNECLCYVCCVIANCELIIDNVKYKMYNLELIIAN